MGMENLVPTGVPSPDHPACSKVLYRLCYWLKKTLKVYCHHHTKGLCKYNGIFEGVFTGQNYYMNM
jgi:hypothetical protein